MRKTFLFYTLFRSGHFKMVKLNNTVKRKIISAQVSKAFSALRTDVFASQVINLKTRVAHRPSIKLAYSVLCCMK